MFLHCNLNLGRVTLRDDIPYTVPHIVTYSLLGASGLGRCKGETRLRLRIYQEKVNIIHVNIDPTFKNIQIHIIVH